MHGSIEAVYDQRRRLNVLVKQNAAHIYSNGDDSKAYNLE
jgi:hypothetical protein